MARPRRSATLAFAAVVAALVPARVGSFAPPAAFAPSARVSTRNSGASADRAPVQHVSPVDRGVGRGGGGAATLYASEVSPDGFADAVPPPGGAADLSADETKLHLERELARLRATKPAAPADGAGPGAAAVDAARVATRTAMTVFEELMQLTKETLPEVCENSWDCDFGLECCDLPFAPTKICCGNGVMTPMTPTPQLLRVPTAERELAEREGGRGGGLLGDGYR